MLEGSTSPNLKTILSLVGVLFIIVGCLTYYVGEIKLINRFVGVRIPPTYNNPEVWREANIRGGLLTAIHGGFMLIIGLLSSKIRFEVFLLILVLPLAVYLAYVTWYAYQL